jgi:hypothetical protein
MTPAAKKQPTTPRNTVPMDELMTGRIIQAVDQITEATKKITDAVYDPDGLIVRTARLEDAAQQIKEKADKVDAATDAFRVHTTAVLDEIKTLVTSHHTDKDLHSFKGIVFHRDILGGLLLVFIIVHSLIPSGVSLWEILKKLAGL